MDRRLSGCLNLNSLPISLSDHMSESMVNDLVGGQSLPSQTEVRGA